MTRRALRILALLTVSALAAEAKAPGPVWTVRTFRVNLEKMLDVRDFSAPKPPREPTPETIRTFLRLSHDYASRKLNDLGVPTGPGVLCAYDPQKATLAVRFLEGELPREDLPALGEVYMANCDKLVGMDLSRFEGPAPRIRALLDRFTTTSNHRQVLVDLESSGEIRHLSSLHLDSRSGQVTKIEQGDDSPFPTAYVLEDGDFVTTEWDRETFGESFEGEPVVHWERQSLEIALSPILHYAPPERVPCPLLQTPEGGQITGQVTHTFFARLTASITALSGQPRVLGVWRPQRFAPGSSLEKEAGTNRLQIAILIPQLVPNMPPENLDLARWIEKYGDPPPTVPSVVAERKSPPNEPPSNDLDSNDLYTQIFHVHPGFLSSRKISPGKTAKEVLEEAGVTFPPGAAIITGGPTADLIVRNTQSNLDHIAVVVRSMNEPFFRNVVARLAVVQAPAAQLRNGTPVLQRLAAEATPSGPVRIVGDCWLECRSDQSAKFEAGRLHRYFVPGVKIPEATLRFESKTRLVGTTFEMTPSIGPDGRILDMNFSLEFHSAPPTPSPLPEAPPGFHATKITSQITLLSGTTRLIGVWKPTGTPELDGQDILQAAFLQANVVPVDEPDP